MRSILAAFLVVSAVFCVTGAAIADASETTARPLRPVHTFSIVARDPQTGELGVAVQSHWFSVGSVVSWAEPGVGAVATQSLVDRAYGPLGLDLMRAGKTAGEALRGLLAADQHADVRQVGMVDADGNVAAHTGENSIMEFCDRTGDDYTVQANLMWKPTVCDAMAEAFEAAQGDLAERLMSALEGAQRAGGDIRGQQSAALLVVAGERGLPAWKGRIFDLRVEDHATPIAELRRLLTTARAYRLMTEGDDYIALGETEKALKAYADAEALAPDNHEAVFWHAVTLAAIDRVEEAIPLFDKAFEAWPLWRELVPKLGKSGILPDDPALIERIVRGDSDAEKDGSQ